MYELVLVAAELAGERQESGYGCGFHYPHDCRALLPDLACRRTEPLPEMTPAR
jgi:hypothetical protein